MLYVVRRTFSWLALTVTMLGSAPTEAGQSARLAIEVPPRAAVQRRVPEGARAGPLPFVRTELYFGTARPDGVVSEEEFRTFLDAEITPRFPDGLTLLKGDGQFRGEDDAIIKEQSFVLVLLYPYESTQKSGQRIQHIRETYKEQFGQQSVLRVDDPFIVWVSF
jgi:Protein of unknown function (DUF3574)